MVIYILAGLKINVSTCFLISCVKCMNGEGGLVYLVRILGSRLLETGQLPPGVRIIGIGQGV
jgi:hypothetical protein